MKKMSHKADYLFKIPHLLKMVKLGFEASCPRAYILSPCVTDLPGNMVLW